MARMKDKKKAKRTSLRIPGMKDVEGKRPLVAEGEYNVEVVAVEEREGQNAPYLAWELKVVGGKFDGAKLYHNTSLAPQALWNLRGLLEAIGVDVPDDDTDMDTDDFLGKTCGVVIEHETYEGKKQARITDIHPAAEGDDDGDSDDDEPKASASKSRKKRDEDDEEDEAPKSRRSRRAARDDDGEEDESKAKGKKSKKKSLRKSPVRRAAWSDVFSPTIIDRVLAPTLIALVRDDAVFANAPSLARLHSLFELEHNCSIPRDLFDKVAADALLHKEREQLAAALDAIYDDFVAKVAQGRGRPVAEIEAIAR